MTTFRFAGALLAAAIVVGACGSDDSSNNASSAKTTTSVHYAPSIDPAKFTNKVTNRYWPLTPGTKTHFEGTSDGEKQTNEVLVTNDTKVIMGVKCVVVHDQVFAKGKLAEDTFDWYAQDADGAVWYFGEDTKELDENGKVTSREGTWEAGKDGAQPGIVMQAGPKPGPTYRQEYLAGEAEDQAKVVKTGQTVTVPAGTYKDVVVTEEWTRLDAKVLENKYYAPGIGVVKELVTKGGKEVNELVSIKKP